MVLRTLFCTVSLTLVLASSAFADDTRLAELRHEVGDLDARVHMVRSHAEKADLRVRRESERIIRMVDDRRASIAVRLDLLEMLSPNERTREATLREMERAYAAASRLLALVEAWYVPR